jgi:hypothetical protein
MADTRYYAYCVHPDDFQRRARGFVRATNLVVALEKAKRQVAKERRRIAAKMNLRVGQLPVLSRTYRVRVWADADMSCAPTAKHHVERS